MPDKTDHQNQSLIVKRAQGCLLGQLAGDALGSQVEFLSAEQIRAQYPDGLREMSGGGHLKTLAGQPTDDSEMALLLARLLADRHTYEQNAARQAYVYWLKSEPFSCGQTIYSALTGQLNHASQANGALMRVSPLGIFGANYPPAQVARWAQDDAAITHPHPLCLQANVLYCLAIAQTIAHGASAPLALYNDILHWCAEYKIDEALLNVTKAAQTSPPASYLKNQGWVLIAWQNALWQLIHAPNLEEAIVDTVMQGGDTDTNAAICGALLGAFYGIDALPERWSQTILHCRPQEGRPQVHHPRPSCFWPTDALELARILVS